MRSYKLPMGIWVFCALTAGCAVDRGEMAAYKEQRKTQHDVWLQRNWRTPDAEPRIAQDPLPTLAPPQRKVIPKCLDWVPFRIVFYVCPSQEEKTEECHSDEPTGPVLTAWNEQFTNPDAQREHERMGPLPPPFIPSHKPKQETKPGAEKKQPSSLPWKILRILAPKEKKVRIGFEWN